MLSFSKFNFDDLDAHTVDAYFYCIYIYMYLL